MQCNQLFFGQEHFGRGTTGRAFCDRLSALKPAMSQYGFAVRDNLPMLPADVGGIVQVKYNGMLSIITWNEERGGYVGWSLRGRCYYSLGETKRHPVTEYFNKHLNGLKDLSFVGETYVVRNIDGRSYMTEFNKAMSIIKNPRSIEDVSRIKLAIFDYVKNEGGDSFGVPVPGYLNRFERLRDDFMFPVGCDNGVVHLPDFMRTEGSFQDSHAAIQDFWNEFISERGFEGLVMHTDKGEEYKIKFRDTLDAAIIAFRMASNGRPICENCGTRFDAIWLRKLARDGVVKRSEWFDYKGRLLSKGQSDTWVANMRSCPLCGGSISNSLGPNLGAKIALMTSDGDFVDIADGVQLSPISPILDLVEPIYEADGYLWVKPEVVLEVSYQGDQLYVDRTRPVYRFERNRYSRIGAIKAISFRPYRPRLRQDKMVNSRDLRLEQLNYFVDRVRRIRERGHDARVATDEP